MSKYKSTASRLDISDSLGNFLDSTLAFPLFTLAAIPDSAARSRPPTLLAGETLKERCTIANKDINIDWQVYLDVPEGQTRFDFGITLGNRMVGHDRNNV